MAFGLLLALAVSESTAVLLPRCAPQRAAYLRLGGGRHRTACLTAQRAKPAPIPGFQSLVVSQCLSSWGDRCWEFAAPFFLLSLQPNSLGPVAAQGLVVGVATVLAAPKLGRIVDSSPRLRAARGALVVQNSLVATCAIVAAFVLPGGAASSVVVSSRLRWAAVVAFSLGCAGASCASLVNALSVSKDWVVVLAGSAPSTGDASAEATQERLARANAALRKVDLVAKVGAPACNRHVTAV